MPYFKSLNKEILDIDAKEECPGSYCQYPDVMDELKIVDHPVAMLGVRGERQERRVRDSRQQGSRAIEN